MSRHQITHRDPTFHNLLVRSTDQGQTWSRFPQGLPGYGFFGIDCIAVTELSNGDLLAHTVRDDFVPVDVDAIIDSVWPGLAEPAATVVSPFHFGFSDALRPHGYDPERARELFNACDMPEELVLRTPLVIPDRAPQVAAMIQEQLSRIGIRVRIGREADRPKYAMDTSQKRIGHLALFDSSPLSTYRVLQEKISSQTQGLWWQGVKDSKADQLIGAAHLSVDNNKRREAYSRCLSWLHENPHWLYLYHPVKLYAHRAELSGVEVDHAGLIRLSPTQSRSS